MSDDIFTVARRLKHEWLDKMPEWQRTLYISEIERIRERGSRLYIRESPFTQ